MNIEAGIADSAATLDAFCACRKAMLDVLRTVHPMGVAYHGASMVIAAIYGMSVVLTGSMKPFAIGNSVGLGRAAEVPTRQQEVDGC